MAICVLKFRLARGIILYGNILLVGYLIVHMFVSKFHLMLVIVVMMKSQFLTTRIVFV